MKTKPTVTIGIPAYNEEANISYLLEDLLGQKKLLGDLDLLVQKVSGQTDDLHPVLQCWRNRVDDVSRRDEHDLAYVEIHFEIVVAEMIVLLRVQHREQR